MQDVVVNFVVKLLIVSEVVFSIIKLAQDALRELVEINSCEYEYLVKSYLNLLAGQEHPWDRCRFRLLVHRQPLYPRRSHYRGGGWFRA